MPVIILIGPTAAYADQLAIAFKELYDPLILKGYFQSIRSALANQKERTLYILPDLEKPDRYEIFCLSRKNEQPFISIANTSREGLSTSDKNVLILGEFNFDLIRSTLEASRLGRTATHKRTKGLSLKDLSVVKRRLMAINNEILRERPEAIAIVNESEELIIKMYNKGLFKSLEELENSYRKVVNSRIIS